MGACVSQSLLYFLCFLLHKQKKVHNKIINAFPIISLPYAMPKLTCLRRLLLLTITSAFVITAFSQKKPLTQEQMLKNKMPSIVSPPPQFISWDDDEHLVFDKRFFPDTALKTITINPKNGKETIAEKQFGKTDVSEKVYLKNGDIYFSHGGIETRLTENKQTQANPVLSPDKARVAFSRNNDLYVLDIISKTETRLTSDGNDSIMNGYASWVYAEEILVDNCAFWWSPDSKHIAFFRTDDSPVPVFVITDAGGQHGLVKRQRYPKPGDKNPEIRIGIASLDNKHITWADFNEHDDQYFGLPYWKPGGSALMVTWMNREQNNLKIYEVNLQSGTKKELYNEKQKTWIRLDNHDRLTLIKNGQGMIILNDQTGWRHIYYHDGNGKLINPVTAGKFSVTSLKYIDEKNEQIYFTARKENSARTDLYSIRLNGKDMKRLTFGDFNHDTRMSPSGNYFTTTYSNTFTPVRIAVLDKTGKLIKQIADTKGPDFDNYVIAKTELLRIKSEDGLFDLPATITWPIDMDTSKRYPVLVNIYGGPGASSVVDYWNFNRFQQWYATEGLIAISIDHRGSGHFGSEGSDYMYHKLGYWEIKDYGTVIKWLIEKGYADPKRIGIMGYSYGGYVASYALTYGADIFTHGIDGSGVTDWSLYDTHYTERYMGTTLNNAEGYKTSSVLTYADKFKGKLLITHGVIDDNVHLQNSMQLNSKLQDLKKDFDFVLYSGGTHGSMDFSKQIHFQNIRLKFFYKYLLEKPMPDGLLR